MDHYPDKSLIKVNWAIFKQIAPLANNVSQEFIAYGRLNKLLQIIEFVHDIMN